MNQVPASQTTTAEPVRRTRTKARKRAVDILFEAELRERDVLQTLAERTDGADPPVREFTTALVKGVVESQAALDQQLAAHLAEDWTLTRLPRVDRAVLRIAAYELQSAEEPVNVVIAEAVALASELSTDASPGFVNGVLASLIAAQVEPGSAPDGARAGV